MAQFRGTIKGQRGEASRLGSTKSGLCVACNGWHDGVEVRADVVDGKDTFHIYANGGSAGDGLKKYLGLVVDGTFHEGGKRYGNQNDRALHV